MKNLIDKYSHFSKEVILVMRKPVMSALPGHLSFFLLLSIIPIILLFGVIASALSLSFDSLIDFLKISLPASTSKLIIPLFSQKIVNFNVVLLIISAIYLSSRGTKAIIISANNIYGVNRKSIQDLVKSIIITILLIILFLFMIFILILGGKILELLYQKPEISGLISNITYIFNYLKWPVSLIFIFFTIKIIYLLTPNKKISGKSVNKGSIFTTISWIIITYFYSFYVTHYASYDTYYGGASSLIVLMLWIYLISELFVIGMIINSIEDKRERI